MADVQAFIADRITPLLPDISRPFSYTRSYVHHADGYTRNKKLCYRRRTARRAMSVKNLVNRTNKLYSKSTTNRSNMELEGYS